jgi:hypothetical protein
LARFRLDTLGDTLGGTRGIMMDMFRQPDKLLAAMERLVPLAVDMGARSAALGHNPIVCIPLHKGADGFMSDQDFKKYYWPTLKAVILGLVNEGLVPWVPVGSFLMFNLVGPLLASFGWQGIWLTHHHAHLLDYHGA